MKSSDCLGLLVDRDCCSRCRPSYDGPGVGRLGSYMEPPRVWSSVAFIPLHAIRAIGGLVDMFDSVRRAGHYSARVGWRAQNPGPRVYPPPLNASLPGCLAAYPTLKSCCNIIVRFRFSLNKLRLCPSVLPCWHPPPW